ncbi:hypothetical protein ONE63_004790 [Megalurothrips usitatus]|uniref:CCD97-like C-terminal domain-containing protein n=1 Tax=Megalurothrips usitatus TaxID=439358 RepID=A0AAV7X1K2_9NEOP|nr:hypothetical protein ONE63_004790 [Megalurothrips usitatus]
MPCLAGDGEAHGVTMDIEHVELVEAAEAEPGPGPSTPVSKSGLPLNKLRSDLLDFLCTNDRAHFKSQQKGDPELPEEQKRKIAEDLLDHSPARFLSRFGQCLREDHLKYFSGDAPMLRRESYEINYHLKGLKRFYCKATHDVDVKNRRYDALQKMLAAGNSYFSEDEMRQRNPYLYEQLVGQYLTEEERKERETPDLENISFVNLMLMKIARDETKELKNKQEEEEVGAQWDSSVSSDENEEEMADKKSWDERGTWGETPEDVTKLIDRRKIKRKKQRKRTNSELMDAADEIPDEERVLLMHEFVSTMYKSFLDGNDEDFDYSQVDCNPDYDCIEVRERDEEEKYFDADAPEDEEMGEDPGIADAPPDLGPGTNGLPPPPSLAERRKAQEEEEDTLDAFMKTVECPVQTSDLTNAFQNLCQQSSVQRPEKSRVVKKSHVIKINLKQN